jgi:hypothetical protein
LVEDRHPQCGRPAVDRYPALDPAVDRHTALNATVDGNATLDATLDRVASVHPTLDRIETLDQHPSVEWIYALDELAQPRLLGASAWQHAVAPEPVDVKSALRWVPRRWWTEALTANESKVGKSKGPVSDGTFFC